MIYSKIEMKNIDRIYLEQKEKFFSLNQNKSFLLFEGEISNVLVSAPHAVSQTRNGQKKLADINTGPLALTLNKLGYSCLVKTKDCGDDANYDLQSDYKNFIQDYV